jgi:DNA-3-methyladenine glycosylase
MPRRSAEQARLLRGLQSPPARAARFLLGKLLVRRRGRRVQTARIVETEAYLGQGDPAAHVFRGRTRRNAPLFGAPGTAYVYFVYGMHHCLNLAVDREGAPGCVLIRAAELIRDDGDVDTLSCSGPGRLCRTLGIDTSLSGCHVFEPAAELTLREAPRPTRIGVSVRVGITQAADRLLRFYDTDSRAVTRLRAGARKGGMRRQRSAPTLPSDSSHRSS